MLRGMRLGYGWSARHRAFIRCRPADDGCVWVDVAPADDVPVDAGRPLVHSCWWEGDDPQGLLDMCQPLRALVGTSGPTAPMSWLVDVDGVPV